MSSNIDPLTNKPNNPDQFVFKIINKQPKLNSKKFPMMRISKTR